jgi:hypothetical protein
MKVMKRKMKQGLFYKTFKTLIYRYYYYDYSEQSNDRIRTSDLVLRVWLIYQKP